MVGRKAFVNTWGMNCPKSPEKTYGVFSCVDKNIIGANN